MSALIQTPEVIRSKAALDAAVSRGEPTGEIEVRGVFDAAWMAELVPAAIPAWLDRMHGITHAAKHLFAVVAEGADCGEAELAQRFGMAWRAAHWSVYLDEVVAVGLVVRGGGRLRVVRRAA